jgi:hypothetical protein
MSRDQLCDLWHGESPSPIEKEGEEMLSMVIERTRSFDRRIAVRNAIECVAALGVVGIFAWFAWRAPSLLERAGNAMVAASGLWIAYYILRFGSGPRRLDPGVSLNAYNQLLRANYEQQIRLLRTVKYWYLLPPYVGILVVNLGLGLRLHAEGKNLWGAVVTITTVTCVFVLVWIANEVYGVRHLKHLERELSSIEGSEL